MQNSETENPNPNPFPPWIELPDDITTNILHRLGAEEILETAQKVCTRWRRVCKDPSMWRVIDIRNPGLIYDNPHRYEIMCRRAVDFSRGQLIEINIQSFGTNQLLFYIAQRCNLLKRLKLENSYVSGKGLTEAVKNFRDLEELHLFLVEHTTAKDIENIGTCCPNLKSFTYDNSGFRCQMSTDGLEDWDVDDNAIALAVAKSMPNLCNLALLSDKMNNEGLEAVLNSCPHLKSLDLHCGYNVDLSGDLGKRCSQQLELLKPPRDSRDDYTGCSSVYEGYDLCDCCGDSSGDDTPSYYCDPDFYGLH